MFDLQWKLEGGEVLNLRMKEVGHEVSYKGGRFALRKAANLVAGAVKEGALRLDDPKTSEQIAKNVAVRWGSKRFKRTGDLMFRVGILGGAGGNLSKETVTKKSPGGDTRYWRLLEFGTRKMEAKPFMRPAIKQNTNEATQEFIKHAKKAIHRAVKRKGK